MIISPMPFFHIHWFKDEALKWYTASIYRENETSNEWIVKYNDIVEWIKANIEKYDKHTRYKIEPETLTFKFRYERNYIVFNLKWM